MEQLFTISKIAFSVFVSFSIYYILIKIVRTAILSTNRWINLDDINFILLASVVIALASFQNSVLIKILFFVPVLIYTLLLWIDAIIFYLYSFEINKRNLTEFLNDYKTMFYYSTRSYELIKRYPWILFALPLSLFMIISIFFASELPNIHVLVIPIIFIVSIFVLQKFSQSILRNIVLFAIIIIPNFIFSGRINFLINFLTESIPNSVIALLFYMILATIFILNIFKKTANHTFFTISSNFRKFLRENKLLNNSTIKIKKEHNKLITPKRFDHTPTKYFGVLKGANVILITIESLGQKYIKENKNLRLPFMKSISSGATKSINHYAISPHTNQFLTHLFSSNYNHKNNYLFLELLHNSNYNTAFIYSDDLNLWETNELIQQIGFQDIIDINSLGKINDRKGDYVLLNSINNIKDLYNNSPCFIQLLTQQSHYPYLIVNKKQFNNYSQFDLKSKYLNSIEEADFVLGQLFDELSNLISLEDTLIIYTGDHGQSFGELGYKTHSNSTINAQI
ncbi:MAG: sulfatase-like hydrolase/transferase [Planctomycetia bacterium]|nr:sulfatase-like hydrolase/transferase [Planctomycetia bacterium]